MQFVARFSLALLYFILSIAARAPSSQSPSNPTGVWSAFLTADRGLSGAITVTSIGATIAGQHAQSTTVSRADGDGRVYHFPAGEGELRVEGSSSGTPVAFWVQPATFAGAPYATPVFLRPVGSDQWRGIVQPLPDRIEMSLYVQRDAQGQMTAFLRDPLYNIGRSFGTMTVEQHRDELRFIGKGQPFSGTLQDGDTLALTLPGVGIPQLVFRRRPAATQAVEVSYETPLSTSDGWHVANASEAGFRTAALDQLGRFAAGGPPTSVTSPAVQAVLVARHGKLVMDDYFGGFDEATLHDTRSAGKTYADVVAGAAIEAGVPIDAQTPILPLFARYGKLAHPDPRKAHITLADALSMSTGLDCDDNDPRSAGNEDAMQNQTKQPDWYRLLLDAPLVRDPGRTAVYCSASINLAGGAIAAAAHVWLPSFFAERVATPLQMQRYALNLTPTGEWYLGGGAYVRPRDFLKIGELFLDGGNWHGRHIIPRSWIRASWDARVSLGPSDGYGFAWHVRSYTVDHTTYRAYEAQGNGGQILDVLPQLDLAVMLAMGNYNNYGTWGPMRDAIVTRVIVAIAP